MPTAGEAMDQQHQQLLSQQDATLDSLGRGVQRVKALAGVMRDELGEQAIILDSLDEDVEKADTNMNAMSRRLKILAEQTKSSERAQWSIITCLLVVLGVLTFMVMSD
uniref:t-SNARE coiled-coil homology domain-containing protein n=1 Tax=Coccolithus braarudii TaxID=221442 RepID=A0A7S0Q6T0_9EUKA|mmetsp:Transcript_43411/g.92394  ORF Transcript_43411/g.92394 Transcript_43411/m.92394 type:complete len:108 (+) Transcript_43411:2-325(+)